jgi:C4-dicarboxylate transporter/malic acid transport protein
MAYPRFSDIIRNFAPGWLAAVMGTGILAMVTENLSRRLPVLFGAAYLLHWLNTAIFMLLAPVWLGRWLRFGKIALSTLRHPVQADFYPTFSIGMLVLAAEWHVFSPASPQIALIFWWPGAVITFVFSFAVLFHMLQGDHILIDHITPAKFIPAVGLVVIPLAGAPLLREMSGVVRDWALFINTVGMGSGSMMYMGLLGLTLHRGYLHKPANGTLLPTAWIHLAPIGVIPVGLLNLLTQMPYPVAREMVLIIMMLVWGFGVWWLIMAVLLTLAEVKKRRLPFALSWWGLIFPLGAFVAEGLQLNQETGSSGFLAISVTAWLLLLILWLITAIKTGHGVWTGRIFLPDK